MLKVMWNKFHAVTSIELDARDSHAAFADLQRRLRAFVSHLALSRL
jgi:hypothetical protein